MHQHRSYIHQHASTLGFAINQGVVGSQFQAKLVAEAVRKASEKIMALEEETARIRALQEATSKRVRKQDVRLQELETKSDDQDQLSLHMQKYMEILQRRLCTKQKLSSFRGPVDNMIIL